MNYYKSLTLIDYYEYVKKLYQLTFGEQFLQRVTIDSVLITTELFGIIISISLDDKNGIFLKKSMLNVLPHMMKYVLIILCMESFGVQVREMLLYSFIWEKFL